VGIIGLPSAGKSTLIASISNAKPKIAAYHFTTLIPNLGVVTMDKFGGSNKQTFVVADIPGLIEGASEGKGLGHQFLRHTSRTKLLIHLLDGSLDSISDDFKTINKELKKFDKELAKKEQIVVINKTDLFTAEQLAEKVKELQKTAKTKQVFSISALAKKDLKPLAFRVIEKLDEIQKQPKPEPKTESIPVLKPHLEQVKFEIDKVIKKKDHTIFRITGHRIEQLITMTNISTQEGLERIYHYMNKLGIKKAIEKKGATFGDIIRVLEVDIPYRK